METPLRPSFLRLLREGALSVCRGVTRFSVMPQPRSLDDVQQDLAQRYGIDFSFDDRTALASDWKAVGNDMKNVLKSVQQKKVVL